MDDEETLGPGSINWLASNVADGTATPEDARRLLVEFVRQADTGSVHPLLVAHLRTCIGAYLNGRKVLDPAPQAGRDSAVGVLTATLDKAFGLIRVAPGGPRTDRDTKIEVAAEVLGRYLADESLPNAIASVSVDRKARNAPIAWESKIKEAWNEHKADGLVYLRISRLPDVDPSAHWTPQEIARLNVLFYGELWYVPPGVDAKEMRDAVLWEVDRPDADRSDLDARLEAVIVKYHGPRPTAHRAGTRKKNSRKKVA